MSTPSAPKLSPAEDQNYAGLAQILGILGILPSLIIWLVFKDRGAKTDRLAKEALNFQITMVGLYIIASIINVVSFGWLSSLWFIPGVLTLIFSIIAFTKVQAGEDYKYPVTIRLIK